MNDQTHRRGTPMNRCRFRRIRLISTIVAFLGLGLCAAVAPAAEGPLLRYTGALRPLPPAAESAGESAQAVAYRQPAGPVPSVAPPGDDRFSGRVPIETAVQYALANNPEIQAARYRARALGARVPQAASLPDPMLMTSIFLESIETAAGPQEVALSLSQKFPWFGKRGLRSQVAYHEAMAAYARVTALELQVMERVKRAYYDVYFLQHAIDVVRTLEPRLADVREIARTKVETSKAGLESVLRVEVELSGLATRIVELEQTKTDAQVRLATLLHLPPDARIEAVPVAARSEVGRTARLLVDLAEAYQPELQARRREVARDQTSVDLACREYWPDVTVGFNWFEMGSQGLSPVATGDDAYALAVGVNLPIYRGRLDAAVRESRYNTMRSRREYSAALDRVRGDVEALYARFQEHDRILAILGSEIIPRAERTLELSIEAYRLDKLSFQQLIDTYRTLLNYRIDFHKREALREQIVASLERAVGTTVTGSPATDAQAISPAPPAP